MKVVEIRLHPMHDGEKVYGFVAIEKRSGEGWKRVRTFAVESGAVARRIWLEDDQRLVVEADADVEIVEDRDQRVATKRPKDPGPRRKLEEERLRERDELEKIYENIHEEAIREATRRLR